MAEPRLVDLLAGEGDLAARSAELEENAPEAIVAAAVEAYGDGAVIGTAFGAAGICVLHMAQQADPNVRAYYLDTGFIFEETAALIDEWEQKRKLKLDRVLPILTPEQQAEQHGNALWESDPDLCCGIRKVEPNDRYLQSKALWIAGLRRDESPSRAETPMLSRVTLGNGHTLLKLCPLVTWTRKDVWRYVFAHALPYNPLHDRGYPSIGCTHCTHAVAEGEPERAGRWSGSQKLECGLHTARKKP